MQPQAAERRKANRGEASLSLLHSCALNCEIRIDSAFGPNFRSTPPNARVNDIFLCNRFYVNKYRGPCCPESVRKPDFRALPGNQLRPLFSILTGGNYGKSSSSGHSFPPQRVIARSKAPAALLATTVSEKKKIRSFLSGDSFCSVWG